MRLLRIAAALAFAGFANLAVAATDYPTKSVTLVVPFAPGGSNDIVGRYVADRLSKIWGQPVVVENMPGAGSAIGSAHVAKAKPDGYTLLINSVTFTMNAAVQNLPFDPANDFQPVGMIGKVPLVLVVGPALPVKSYDEFMAEAKKRPLKYATSGLGGVNQFGTEVLKKAAGLKMEPVHYKGGSPAMADVIGGHVDLFFSSMTQALPQIRAGLMTGIMVSSEERSPATPDLPTMVEKGLKDAVVNQWWGLFAPAGTPDEIVRKINADLNTIVNSDETKEFLAKDGGTPAPTSVEQFAETVKKETAKWKEIAQEANIKAE